MTRLPLQASALDLVIFDLDGVLADSSAAHASAWATLFADIGLDPVDYSEIAGRPTLDVVRERTRERAPSEEQIARWVAQKQQGARRALEDAAVTFADTEAAVARLRAARLRLAVGTGASGPTAQLLLQRAGIADAFETVVTAEDTAKGKPSPDVYLQVLERTGADAARALVIEDSHSGLLSAEAAGTWSASVRSGVTHPGPRFCGAHPDLGALVDALGVKNDG